MLLALRLRLSSSSLLGTGESTALLHKLWDIRRIVLDRSAMFSSGHSFWNVSRKLEQFLYRQESCIASQVNSNQETNGNSYPMRLLQLSFEYVVSLMLCAWSRLPGCTCPSSSRLLHTSCPLMAARMAQGTQCRLRVRRTREWCGHQFYSLGVSSWQVRCKVSTFILWVVQEAVQELLV